MLSQKNKTNQTRKTKKKKNRRKRHRIVPCLKTVTTRAFVCDSAHAVTISPRTSSSRGQVKKQKGLTQHFDQNKATRRRKASKHGKNRTGHPCEDDSLGQNADSAKTVFGDGTSKSSRMPVCVSFQPTTKTSARGEERSRGREVQAKRNQKERTRCVCVCVYLCGSVTSDWESEKADSLNEIADKRNSWPCLTL